MADDLKQAQSDTGKAPIVNEHKIQLVIAHIGSQYFGVPIDQIREVVRYKSVTAIPNSPPFIAGISSTPFH